MQSVNRSAKKWLLEFDTMNTGVNPLMGWETSQDTMSEVKLEFPSIKQAINYAKKIILIIMSWNLKKAK